MGRAKKPLPVRELATVIPAEDTVGKINTRETKNDIDFENRLEAVQGEDFGMARDQKITMDGDVTPHPSAFGCYLSPPGGRLGCFMK